MQHSEWQPSLVLSLGLDFLFACLFCCLLQLEFHYCKWPRTEIQFQENQVCVVFILWACLSIYSSVNCFCCLFQFLPYWLIHPHNIYFHYPLRPVLLHSYLYGGSTVTHKHTHTHTYFFPCVCVCV